MELIKLISILENLFASYGYAIVFLASFVEITPLGWTIPGGTILAIAGFFAYGARVSLLVILVLGWLGAWLVLLLAYFLGNKTGYQLVKKIKQEKNAERAKILLREHGGVILATSMLASLTRFWVAYIAGTQKYSLLKFLFYSAAASLT
jgi:membrane protein DedA with SNARE-associated domain